MTDARMEPAEFAAFGATLRALNTVVIGVDEADLQRFIDACTHADAIGPYVDPTAWMRGHDSLSAITDSARALLEHRRTLERLARR